MTERLNSRPIIGILTQEANCEMKKSQELLGRDSYVAASYVKAIESAGARVVPIFLNQSEQYYKDILKSINGLVLPGGNVWFYEDDNKTPRDNGYVQASEILYSEVKEINKTLNPCGMYFPLLAICLGFELLLFVDMGKNEYRSECSTIMRSLAVNIENDGVWLNIPTGTKELLRHPVSYFSHRFYVKEDVMENESLKKNWNVLATTFEEERKIKYVSIIESKNYPIIGLQFHPEKPPYEWKEKLSIPHSIKAIEASRFFFDWLVAYSRKNNNCFKNQRDEYKLLINNFSKIFTPEKYSFDEMYLFSNCMVNGSDR